MSTYSTNLAIELIGTGDQAGTWGTTTNNNLGTLIEQAISGYYQYTCTGGTDTITIPNGATGVARNMYLELGGVGGGTLVVPSNRKLYYIYNTTASAITVKVSGQTGVSVPAGRKMSLVCNGTDVVQALDYMASPSFLTPNLGTPSAAVLTNATGLPLTTGVTGTLPVANGGSGTTSISGVVYGNGTSAFTAATGSQIASAIGSSAVTNATNATNILNGAANQLHYQTGASTTSFVVAPTVSTTYLQWNGSAFVWAAATGATTTNAVTFNNSGSGNATGTSFNGSSAVTVSYNTIGAPSVSGTNATGIWGIDISGNAATATSATSATSATTASNANNLGGNAPSYYQPASTAITTSNIASQSVNYATTAGNGGVTSVNGSTGAVTVNALGVNQSWTDVSSSRALNTTYTNNTGKPILVWIVMGYGDLTMFIGSQNIWFFSAGSSARAQMVVPPGQTYSATAAAGRYFNYWYEYA